MNKTIDIHNQFNSAFDHFNQSLFGNKLPKCIITIPSRKGVNGYYVENRFVERIEGEDSQNNMVSEIALNPDNFDREDINILSTLVHEMTHFWQYVSGKPSRARYHNKEWGNKMEEIGLMPSSTGQEGGKRTGQSMTHYIIYGGQFEKSAKEYINNFHLDYRGKKTISISKSRAKSKVKITCPDCGINAWAKPNTNLMCGDCEEHMQPEE